MIWPLQKLSLSKKSSLAILQIAGGEEISEAELPEVEMELVVPFWLAAASPVLLPLVTLGPLIFPRSSFSLRSLSKKVSVKSLCITTTREIRCFPMDAKDSLARSDSGEGTTVGVILEVEPSPRLAIFLSRRYS